MMDKCPGTCSMSRLPKSSCSITQASPPGPSFCEREGPGDEARTTQHCTHYAFIMTEMLTSVRKGGLWSCIDCSSLNVIHKILVSKTYQTCLWVMSETVVAPGLDLLSLQALILLSDCLIKLQFAQQPLTGSGENNGVWIE